eukprot:m.112725 g.112725  ORF g.112725 m.112725 type:complete len:934 (-) comp12984_c0_seq2:76-2877(-)
MKRDRGPVSRRFWIWITASQSSTAKTVRWAGVLVVICGIAYYKGASDANHPETAFSATEEPGDVVVSDSVEPVDPPDVSTIAPRMIPNIVNWPRLLNPFAKRSVRSPANYSECVTIDWGSAEAEDELRKEKNQQLALSLERAKEKDHRGCISTIVDTFCKSKHNILYDYASMKPVSSCDIDEIYREGPDDLRKLYTSVPLPQAFVETRRIGPRRPYKMAILMVVYSRSLLQQIKRAVALMTQPGVLVFFHVDRSQGSDYLRRELTAFSKVERNVFMIPEAFDTIWAGSGLMEMYLSAIKYMLRYEWDHFINLSEVDFPVVTPQEISRVLRQKRGYSFLNANFDKSVKGRMEAIQRQGIEWTSVQCERYMYRLAERSLHPTTQFLVGSDWFILARPYANYVANGNTSFVKAMRLFYHHTILNAESFLHTTAANGAWCATIIWNNHRFENWHAGSGCQCSKRTVDWCGCSPLTVRTSDVPSVLDQATNRWHVRKVDPRIDMFAISLIEANVVKESAQFHKLLPNFTQHLYWANLFHHQDASQGSTRGWSHYLYFAKQLLRSDAIKALKNCNLQIVERQDHPTGGLLHVHALYADKTVKKLPGITLRRSLTGIIGYIIRLAVTAKSLKSGETSEVVIEGVVQESEYRTKISRPPSSNMSRLLHSAVGAGWCLKDLVFRVEGPVFEPGDELRVQHQWQAIDSKVLPNASFVGCYGNGGNYTRWAPYHESSKTMTDCAILALSRKHPYFGLEWSEGFKSRRSECATFNTLPELSTKRPADECKTERGALLGRYYRAAVYRLGHNPGLSEIGTRGYDLEVVSSKGEVVWSKQHESVGPAEQTTTFDLASEIPSLEPGEWAVRTRIGGSAPVDTPFVIAPPSVDDVLWEDVRKYFDFEQVCAHSHGENGLLVGLHHCKLLPPCAEMEWSTLRMGLNLTLT